MNYVLQSGILQDRPGASIAILLSGINGEPGLGFSWAGIISQRWDWGTVDFNVETNLTCHQHGELFLDAMVEGPFKGLIRRVAEVFYDNDFGAAQEISGLIGAIWQVRDTLSFGPRIARCAVNGRPRERAARRRTVRISAQSEPTNEH